MKFVKTPIKPATLAKDRTPLVFTMTSIGESIATARAYASTPVEMGQDTLVPPNPQ